MLPEITVDETPAPSGQPRLIADPAPRAKVDPLTIPGVTTAAALAKNGSLEHDYAFSRLLFRVTVHRWPQKYNFYQRFLYDAERFFSVPGKEAPNVPYFSYIPQYAQLNAEQMRCYLYFRERARAGDCDSSVDFPYILLYIYEIINLPHRIAPPEGANAMAAVWLACRRRYPELDKYLAEWMCDYCLTHQVPLPSSLTPILYDLVRIASFKEFYISCLPPREDGLLLPPEMLLAALSDYSYRSSRYYADNAAVFDETIPSAVVAAMRTAGMEIGQNSLQTARTERDAFCGSLCAQTVKRRIVVEYYSMARSHALRSAVTAAVKQTENFVRRDLKIKSRLNVTGGDSRVQAALNDRFAPSVRRTHPAQAEKEAWESFYDAPSVGVSFAEAAAIEAASWQNTELLAPPEEREPERAPQPEITPQPTEEKTPQDAADASGSADTTTPPGKDALILDALRAVLAGETLEAWCARQAEKTHPARIAALINDAACDELGDVLLEERDGWQLIEEYRADAESFVR